MSRRWPARMPEPNHRLPSPRPFAAALLALAPTFATGPALAGDTSVEWRGVVQAAGLAALERPRGGRDWSGSAGYALTGQASHITDTGLTFGAGATLGSGDYEKSLDRPGDTEALTLNEVWLSFVSVWGQIRVGDDDGAAHRATDLLPLLAGGQPDGFWTRGLGPDASPAARPDHLGRDSDDGTKILVETPRLFGLRAGVSWAPERTSLFEKIEGRDGIAAEEDFWEFGLNYRGDGGPWSYEFGAGYARGEGGSAGRADTESLKLSALGLYGPFSLGAVWFDEQVGLIQGAATDRDGLTLLGGYENGPYGVTVWWSGADTDGLRDDNAYGTGASWRVDETLTLALDLIRSETDHPAAPDRSGTLAQLTLEARF